MATVHQMKRLSQAPNLGGKMRKITNLLKCKKGNATRPNITSRKEGKKCTDSTTLQNNRDLASALSRAKSRIAELETEKLRLQGERQQLVEQVSTITLELKKCNSKDVARKSESSRLIKENSKTLKSKLEKTIEKLMESTELLSDAVQCADYLVAESETGDKSGNCNYSLDITRTPLKLIFDDIHQTSHEADAALSITTMTPSSSSSSSSSDIEITPPAAEDVCVTPVTLFGQEDDDWLHNMDVDTPTQNPATYLPVLCSTPIVVIPAKNCGPAVGLLEVRPEEFEESPNISLTANNIAMSSPRVPSAGLLAGGRRISKRRSAREHFCDYKEPRLNSKLRQGDPHTDCSLFPPRSEQFCLKRKNNKVGNNGKKIMKNNRRISDVNEEIKTEKRVV